jgi:hypothetical protein
MLIAAEILQRAFLRFDRYLEETNITCDELELLSETERKLRLENYLKCASVTPNNLNQVSVK